MSEINVPPTLLLMMITITISSVNNEEQHTITFIVPKNVLPWFRQHITHSIIPISPACRNGWLTLLLESSNIATTWRWCESHSFNTVSTTSLVRTSEMVARIGRMNQTQNSTNHGVMYRPTFYLLLHYSELTDGKEMVVEIVNCWSDCGRVWL